MPDLPANTALIIVDVQDGFDDPIWGLRNNPDAEQNIARLLDAWRLSQRPIFHIQHLSDEPESPLRPDHPGSRIKQIVQPLSSEPVINKNVNSAFIGTDLEIRLKQQGCDSLVIVGLTTDHCVSTTARMAGNLGFRTYVAADATATFDRIGYDGTLFLADEIHRTALASLHDEFATVLTTTDLIDKVPS